MACAACATHVSMIRGTRDTQAITETNMAELRHIVDCGLRVRRWPFRGQGESAMIDEGRLSGISGVLERDGNERVFIFSVHLIHEALALNTRSLRLAPVEKKGGVTNCLY